MADFVISWKTIRLTGTSGERTSSTCQEMASPSRSSSVARISSSASRSVARSFRTTSFLVTTYSGAKWCSTSIESPLLGRSRMCPMLGSTT